MKISIIGLGNVGSTLAYALVLKGLATELILVDKNSQRALGDALDLGHAQSFAEAAFPIRAGQVADTAASDLLILTLSVPFAPPMRTRADLAAGNKALLEAVVPALAQASPLAKILVVTNPVDAMTYWTLQFSGFPSHRVLGIGTLVDSARFRAELSRHLAIHPLDIRAYVLGEHGESQFAAQSSASAGGEPIGDAALARGLLAHQAESAQQIMNAKGYTNFAIASAVAMVVESIVHDSRKTMPVSVCLQDYYGVSDLCLSVPAVIGAQGVERVLKPLLNAEEQQAFQRCAAAVAAQIAP